MTRRKWLWLLLSCLIAAAAAAGLLAARTPSVTDDAPLPYAHVPVLSPASETEAREALADAARLEAAARMLGERTQALLTASVLGEVFCIPCAAQDGTLTEDGLCWRRMAYTDYGFAACFTCCREDGELRVKAEEVRDWNAVLERADARALYPVMRGEAPQTCVYAGDGWYGLLSRAPVEEARLGALPRLDRAKLPELSLDAAGTPFCDAVPGFEPWTKQGSAAQGPK